MAKARIYSKSGKIRFYLYGKSHFVSSINDRSNTVLTSQLGEHVDIELEVPDYETETKACIAGVPCIVENVVFPYSHLPDVTLTEPTSMTFELLSTSQEHDEFDLLDGVLVFDDMGLRIWCHFGLRRVFEYKENKLDLRSDVVDGKIGLVKDVQEGSIIAMMDLVESTELAWNSMQEWIERTEDFAFDYMESFGEYVISTYVSGVPF